MQSQVREMLIRTMNEAMINYETDTNVEAAVDFMQTGVSTMDRPKSSPAMSVLSKYISTF